MKLFLLFSVCALLCACSSDDPMSAGDASIDSGRRDGGIDLGRPDLGMSCLTGEHMCPGGCVADQANDPALGCALGCGSACGAPPEHASAACADDGTCDFRCDPPFTRDFDHCVCAPVTCDDLHITCGTPDNGCGTPLSCGSCGTNESCVDGACACTPDVNEPNNTAATPHSLGSYDDSDDNEMLYTASNLHNSTDGDWFSFMVTDGFDGGDPHITVTLDSIPAGSNYDLELFFACAPGGDSSAVEDCMVYSDGEGHNGCASRNGGTTRDIATIVAHCSTTDEDGTALVHVVPASWVNTCNNYSLNVYVH